jgi:ankyrin repeat protein
MNAISRGDMVTLKGLLAMNVSVNFVLDGTTPLHVAAEKGYSEIVQLLIDHGANFRIENADGKTPLEVALDQKKFVKTTEILFNVSKSLFSARNQAESRRSDTEEWRDQH